MKPGVWMPHASTGTERSKDQARGEIQHQSVDRGLLASGPEAAAKSTRITRAVIADGYDGLFDRDVCPWLRRIMIRDDNADNSEYSKFLDNRRSRKRPMGLVRCFFVLTLCLLSVSTPASAQTPVVSERVDPTEPKLWQFQFQGAPWQTVLRQFAKTSGMSLQIRSLPTGEFTYFDDARYSIPDAIDIFNDHLLPLGYLLVRNESKLTAIASNGKIDDGVVPFVTLAALPRLGRHELASVAVPIRTGNPQALVAEVQELMSSVGTVRALSSSRRLLLTDTGAYLRPIYDLLSGSGIAASEVQTVVYKLRNTQSDTVARAVNDRFKTDSGQDDGQVAQVTYAVPEVETNSLLLQGTPEELQRLQRIIAELDQAASQVLIQALLVEVELGNTDEFGVELGLQDSVLFNRSVIDNIVTISETVTATNGVQTTNDSIISQTSSPGFAFNSPILGNNTSVSPGTLGSQSLSNFGLGRTNGDLGFGGLVLSAGSDSVNVLIRALQANFKVDILSRPHVRTLDNREAFIQAGQQVPVVDGVSVTANGNANPVIRQDRAGIILRVTPKVSPEGVVQLDVSAEKSAFQLTPGSGVPIFTDATNGNIIEAPVKDITTAETTVSARTGQTIVLGGLITRDQSVVERKVPFLGDIPIIKRLFRYDFADTRRSELLIFLTPHIIASDCHSNQINFTETARTHMCVPQAQKLYGDFFSRQEPPPCPENPCPEDQYMHPSGGAIPQHAIQPMSNATQPLPAPVTPVPAPPTQAMELNPQASLSPQTPRGAVRADDTPSYVLNAGQQNMPAKGPVASTFKLPSLATPSAGRSTGAILPVARRTPSQPATNRINGFAPPIRHLEYGKPKAVSKEEALPTSWIIQ